MECFEFRETEKMFHVAVGQRNTRDSKIVNTFDNYEEALAHAKKLDSAYIVIESKSTEKERKFYEDKKQKALQVIDDFIRNMNSGVGDLSDYERSLVVGGLHRIRRLVNDI